jgi:hypothetical protein
MTVCGASHMAPEGKHTVSNFDLTKDEKSKRMELHSGYLEVGADL